MTYLSLSRFVYSRRNGACWAAYGEHKTNLLHNASIFCQSERALYGTARTCLKF